MKRTLCLFAVTVLSICSAHAGLTCSNTLPSGRCYAFEDVSETYGVSHHTGNGGTQLGISGTWQKRLNSGAWSSSRSYNVGSFAATLAQSGHYTLRTNGQTLVKVCEIDPETHHKTCETFTEPFSYSLLVDSF